jgi:hypothetical protein
VQLVKDVIDSVVPTPVRFYHANKVVPLARMKLENWVAFFEATLLIAILEAVNDFISTSLFICCWGREPQAP